jgi:hypothetical protein
VFSPCGVSHVHKGVVRCVCVERVAAVHIEATLIDITLIGVTTVEIRQIAFTDEPTGLGCVIRKVTFL